VADPLRIKRGTRAQLDAAKTGGTLAAGEPYLVTDDETAAVGTGTGAYIDLAAITGAKRIAVVSSLPGTPDADTLYFVTS
jgi:hypothetical protein